MKNMTVMLVEDNKDDEELAVWVLRKIGIENITVARNGLEANTMLHGDESSGVDPVCRPDMILLDLRLPKIDGLDVLRSIRSDGRTKDIMVYALTSSDDPYDKEVCKELGVPAFFAKPLTEKAALSLNMF